MQLLLIFNEKQSFRKLGDIIYQLSEQSGEIYVRRDALTVLFGRKILYGNVMTYGGEAIPMMSPGFNMWDEIPIVKTVYSLRLCIGFTTMIFCFQ